MTLTLNIVSKWGTSSLRRLLAIWFRENKIYRIPFGPLKGLRMRYYHSVQYHMILGRYDVGYIKTIQSLLFGLNRLGKNRVYCDLGANIGIFSLWFSRLCPQGRVYSFEPMPACIKKLQDNVKINSLSNVEVVPLACSDSTGTADFFVGNGSSEISSMFSSWAANGGVPERLTVHTTTLDEFFNDRKDLPDFIKMDIEGAGEFALKGCDRVVDQKRPILFIESHTPGEDLAIGNFAIRHRYEAFQLNERRWVKNLTQTHPSKEGVWGTLLLVPQEESSTARKILLNYAV